MTPHEFITKWRDGGDERRDWHSFFDDLCRLVGHKTPREADPGHTWFTYEYGVGKAAGGQGWADAWKKGHFGWEAKGTGKDLQRAYAQLKMYADALQNPPLLVVTDLRTIIVHTNFTNTVKREYKFTVDQLAEYETRQILEAVFKNPNALRPGKTRTDVTTEAAEKFTALAQTLRERGHEPQVVAHFLNRLVFCMFAEDIKLLPEELFTKLVESSQNDPDSFERRSRALFATMNKGGDFGVDVIDWFNGGLFDDDATLRLDRDELKMLLGACQLHWDEIEPSIFGTLFERGLDPNKRSQLGAHYTDTNTIMKLVQPMVIDPWAREWEEEKVALGKLLSKAKKSISKPAQDRFNRFLERLRAFTVLDPACGSGNFLYLALHALKDIEKRVLIQGEALGLGRQFPALGPANVKGIELNSYAAELARITVWIGEIQWMVQNGYGANRNPILQPLNQIENRDAILNDDGTEATWPQSDVVIGNPPFIGGHVMRGELGSRYTDSLRRQFEGRVEGGADFVCYWFEKARAAIVSGSTGRAGLVATNSIRGGSNRKTLDRVKSDLQITNAWGDEPWFDKGTAVRVSLIGFEKADTPAGMLDGKSVAAITSSLTELVHHDIAQAKALKENKNTSFQGVIPRAEIKKKKKQELGLPDATFNLEGSVARQMLKQPATPMGDPISNVVSPYWIADDVTTRPLDRFIVNFGDRTEAQSAMFQEPFSAIANVKRHREHMEEGKDKRNWWQLARWRPAMLKQLQGLPRYISIPRVAKHHVLAWTPSTVVPDNALVVVARDDDTTFGILQSHIHGIWALRQGSAMGVGNDPRYTHTTCFETFPFPEKLTPDIAATVYANDPRAVSIAEASRALVEARDRWLNPTEWAERVPEVVPGYPDRIIAKSGHEADLKKRTLTNLYNAYPPWLDNLHAGLDAAVSRAYGWEWPLSDTEILRRLFELNQARRAGNVAA